MLLFKRDHVEPILAGAKTETRRLWTRPRVREGATHQCRTRMLDKDSTFAIIRVERVWRERLGDIDDAGARREGYADRDSYLRAFDSINGETDRDTFVYVVRFHLVKRLHVHREEQP